MHIARYNSCIHVAMHESATLRGGPILADNFLPKSVPHEGLILARGTIFGSKSGPGGPVLAGFSAKISPAGPIFSRGTDFGVTGLMHPYIYCIYAA